MNKGQDKSCGGEEQTEPDPQQTVHGKNSTTDGLQKKKILYVRPIHGGTYHVINQGIENGLRSLGAEVHAASSHQDVSALAKLIQPDLVLVLLGDTLPVAQIQAIRSAGIRTAIWFTDDPYYTDVTTQFAPSYDYVITQEIGNVSYYRSLGCSQVHYLPLGVNTRIFHKRIDSQPPEAAADICFMGTAWNNRLALFDELAPFLASKQTVIVGYGWQKLKHYALLAPCIRPVVLSPEDSAELMRGSKIVINHHRSYDDSTYFDRNTRKLPARSINPRTFEIAACGAFQITDVREELPRYFTPGEDIETYSAPKELTEKLDYYLTHEDERSAIAERSYRKTIEYHNYEKRAEALMEIIFPSEQP